MRNLLISFLTGIRTFPSSSFLHIQISELFLCSLIFDTLLSLHFLGPLSPPPISMYFYILISFSPLYPDFESICPYSFINSLDFRFSLPFIVPSLCSSPIVLSLCFHVISPPPQPSPLLYHLQSLYL